MTLNDAINQRVSVRHFKELPMQVNELTNFMRGIEAIPSLFENETDTNKAKIASKNLAFKLLTHAEAEKMFSNLNKVCVYAPYYLFFYGEVNSANFLNCGYIGQIASLWLACNNLAACFQHTGKLRYIETMPTEKASEPSSTTKSEEAKASDDNTEPNGESLQAKSETISEKTGDSFTEAKRLPLALALGYADKSAKLCPKKAVNKCLISGSPTPNLNLQLLLQTACQAPSEYNSQPWRFWTNDNTVHIFTYTTWPFKSDWHQAAESVACGALVANLATLAELKNLPYQIFCEKQVFSEIEKLTYQLSFRLL